MIIKLKTQSSKPKYKISIIMKNKFHIPILILGLMFLIPNVSADSPITGTAYGENIGLIHFDYITAINPFDECADMFDSSPTTINCPLHAEYLNYHVGPREDFYLSPMSPLIDYSDPTYSSSYTAKVGDASTCTDDHCFLNGYLWSGEIGWIALSGNDIQASLSPAEFPEISFAKISSINGVLSGFIWSERAGWVRLSSDGFISGSPQSATNWGVWMNPFLDPELPLTSGLCTAMTEIECDAVPHICNWDSLMCQPLSIEIGRPLQGNAWSEKLGWIKFNSESEFFNGVYTTWISDISPPVLDVVSDNLWFANDNAAGLLTWDNFATDDESGINFDESQFIITTDGTGCASAIDDTDGGFGNDSILSINPATNALKVVLPFYGILGTDSYCKYKLSAKIVNGAGLTLYIDDSTDPVFTLPPGYDTDDPEKYRGTPLTFFVRSGDYSTATFTSSTAIPNECTDPSVTAIADGADCYEYHFNPVDIVGNPIVSVMVNQQGDDLSSGDPTDWMRETESKFVFNSEMKFDETKTLPTVNRIVPINFGSGVVYQTNPAPIEYITTPPESGSYPVTIKTYAPTIDSNTFSIDSAVITIRDSAMPSTSSVVDTSTDAVDPYDETYNELITLIYNPAISITSGSLDTDIIIPSVDMVATYTVSNNSPTENISKIAVDNRMFFDNVEPSDGYGEEVLDMRNIIALDNLSEDSFIGRTDPISLNVRYLVMTNDNDQINNDFHDSGTNFHIASYDFMYQVNPTSISSSVLGSGQYEVDGIFDLTQEEKDRLNDADSENDPTINPIYIDRNDVFTSNSIAPSADKVFSFSITPNQYMGVPPTAEVLFDIKQYVAYKTPAYNDKYTIYEASSLISDVGFRSIGVQATGVVTGENVYDSVAGRDLDSVSPTDASELKKQIRSNVADITRNMNLETCSGGDITLLPEGPGECVVVDDINNTIIAVYTSDVTLNSNITVPEGKSYSVILTDGANLTIKGDILPGDSIAFGIITLADDEGDGGNVYIYPEPTNISALLYAEGSLISRNDSGDCYGAGTCDLSNQLYWQGSIISRNTIGGAPSATLPPGIDRVADCGATVDAYVCAQKFDMDYIRRFVLRPYKDGEITVGHYAQTDAKYSGGNICTGLPLICTFNGDTTMASIVFDGNTLIDLEPSYDDPFFIEQDNRPAPPGFSTSAGFSRSQIIR